MRAVGRAAAGDSGRAFAPVALRRFGPGLVGLGLACLLAAPVAAQPAPEKPITLAQAVEAATTKHLQPRLARERIRESEARIAQSWASLNPTVNFSANQYNRSVNLAAQGLSGGALPANIPIPSFIGPFYTFDSRLQIAYTLIDAAARWNVKSAEVGKKVAEQEEVLARQQVGTLASLAFVQLTAARQAREAVAADVKLSEDLLKLARDQKAVGAAAGIDVTRAENQLVEQKLRQQSAEDRVRRASLELARLTGDPLNTVYLPATAELPAIQQGLTPEAALQRGLEHRVEVAVTRLRQDQLLAQISAAESENSPRLGVAADYGFTGNTPGSNVFGTHNVGLILQVPIFDGGLSEGKADQLRSQLEQSKLQLADQQIQVEEDVRSAFLKLQLAQEQLVAARSNVELAEKELQMSSNRLRAGLSASLEVTTAQASLTRARDNELQARAGYQLALVELAASMGEPEAIFTGGNP